jgi:hypothetical protein
MRAKFYLVFIGLLLGTPCALLGEELVFDDRPPLRVGWTFRKSPVLYYFVSEATSLPMRFSWRGERSDPLELPLPNPARPGFYAIRLKDYDIELDEGAQYRWFVFLERGAAMPQPDILAAGVIERPEEEMMLIDMRLDLCNREQVIEMLQNNLWYDGAACLHELIEAQPDDVDLLLFRDRVYREQPFQLMGSLERSSSNQ